MSEQLKESLSAAVDGEADAFELRRVMDEAAHDPELLAQWNSYHLIRDTIRARSAGVDAMQRERVRSGVWQQLQGEVAQQSADQVPLQAVASRGAPKNRWLGPLTGVAVAASVAVLVAFNAGSLFNDQPAEWATASDPEAAFSNANIAQPRAVAPVVYQQARESDRRRLDSLRLHHYQNNAVNNAGAVSFVKMMTFDRLPRVERELND